MGTGRPRGTTGRRPTPPGSPASGGSRTPPRPSRRGTHAPLPNASGGPDTHRAAPTRPPPHSGPPRPARGGAARGGAARGGAARGNSA
ncbi:hypothetical protein CAG99_01830 [Streptomyces marincola]|uniref:Uncharacterized protein n=1 Tax=Streptomyces marincola TaxID=2878388 RepID=A0A1W7CSQ8_9ACTN|nr:hypothetical protein CAG99_01830 [Streptomyces marincola]